MAETNAQALLVRQKKVGDGRNDAYASAVILTNAFQKLMVLLRFLDAPWLSAP